MNQETFLNLPKENLLEVLNSKHKANPVEVLSLFKIEEYQGICAECGGQTHEKAAGDEGWTVCSCCGAVEGKTYEIDVIPELKVGFNYSLDRWTEVSDDIGQEL